ncbi:50S ribosomal protein L30e [Candidatus Micrarchaeota archaeon]|nr:50S ribosomal protein L30e [Candidatus Micrarchaeota archaeon]
MDVSQSVRLAVDSGKVEVGLKKALHLSLIGGAKAIVIARNCPAAEEIKQYALASKIPIVDFDGNGVELGAACGKPFSISALSVVDVGNSDILKLGPSKK